MLLCKESGCSENDKPAEAIESADVYNKNNPWPPTNGNQGLHFNVILRFGFWYIGHNILDVAFEKLANPAQALHRNNFILAHFGQRSGVDASESYEVCPLHLAVNQKFPQWSVRPCQKITSFPSECVVDID